MKKGKSCRTKDEDVVDEMQKASLEEGEEDFLGSCTAPRTDLWKLLKDIKAPRCFSVSGVCSPKMTLPGLFVNGIGNIDLPLNSDAAKSLSSRCDEAPFGRGEKTVVDLSIRKTKQLEPEQFKITNPSWDTYLQKVVSEVKSKLGIQDNAMVEAQLYKLLLYEPGSFFKPHRDSEKVRGMFGSLIIILPSLYTGGDLVVQHAGDTKTYDQAKNSPSQTQFCAFYADCKHELKTVTSGHRLCLVYNLVKMGRRGDKPSAKLNSSSDTKLLKQINAISQEWTKQWRDNEDVRDLKLVIMANHMYTPESMKSPCWEKFKGKDATIIQVLDLAAAAGADITWDVATVSLYEEGCSWDEEYEWAETLDSTMEITSHKFGTIPIYEEEIVPIDFFKNKEPDSEEFTPTGNEGVQAYRWYTDYAIVVWPKSHQLSEFQRSY